MKERPARLSVIRCCAMLFICLSAQSSAQESWRRTYGGLDSDKMVSIQQVSTGGYISCGSTGSFGIAGDSYVLKLDASGVVEWSQYFGGIGAQDAVVVRETQDGFIVAGSTSSGSNGGYDFDLRSIDQTGNTIWSRELGSADWDLCTDLTLLPDGYVIVGSTYGYGSVTGSALVMRTNLSGDTLWTSRIDGPGQDEATSVCIDVLGNIIVCGRMGIGSSNEDGFVSKLDPNGVVQWTRLVGGSGEDNLTGIVEAWDGGYVAVGGTRSYSSVLQVLIRKIGVDGDSLWQRTYGSGGDTRMRRISRSLSSGYVLAGYNSFANAGGRDMFLISVDADGWFVFGKNYGGLGDEEGHALDATDDGGYIVAGISNAYGPGVQAAYVVKCLANGETVDDTVYPYFDPVSVNEVAPSANPTLWPNPSNGTFRIGSSDFDRLRILDLNGRVVGTHNAVGHDGEQVTSLPNGVYIVEGIRSGRVIFTSRLMLLRE